MGRYQENISKRRRFPKQKLDSHNGHLSSIDAFGNLCGSWDKYFVSLESEDLYRRGEYIVTSDVPLTDEQIDQLREKLTTANRWSGTPMVMSHGVSVSPVKKNSWCCEYCSRTNVPDKMTCPGCGASR
jgi:hypothetical protein